MDSTTKDIIPLLHECIVAAGKAILSVYDTDFAVDTKQDETPITEADRRAHDLIQRGLRELQVPGFENLPLLSEEGMHTPYAERKDWDRYWLVDPLDGTKEFVNRNGEFTVNIALIEDRRPAMGFVYVPVTDVFYYGIEGFGAFRVDGASTHRGTERTKHAAALPDKHLPEEPVTIVASRSHLNDETRDFISRLESDLNRKTETIQAGSSLKLCRIAEGSAHLYPRFGPTMEWDTAAAHGVCTAAGCDVIHASTGAEMRYNKENLRNPYFIAAAKREFLISANNR